MTIEEQNSDYKKENKKAEESLFPKEPARVEHFVQKSEDGLTVTEDFKKEFVFFPITLTKTTTYNKDGETISVKLYSLGVEAEKTFKEGTTFYTGAFYPIDGVKQLDFEEGEAKGAFQSLGKKYLSLLKDEKAFQEYEATRLKENGKTTAPKIIVRGSRLYTPPERQNEG